MKEVKDFLEIEKNCSPEAFFRLVYLDSSFLRRFHAQVNNDDDAIVPSWDPRTKTRDLTFRTPVNAPSIIANLIKTDSINVKESQSVEILQSGSIQIESTPVPQIPGASNFSSTATIRIEKSNRPTGSDGCSITATVLVTATGPWGLTSTIESFMATAARQSLRQFLGFCCHEINELQNAGALDAALSRIPSLEEAFISVPPLGVGVGVMVTAIEEIEDTGEGMVGEFYDAEEAASAMLDLAGLQPEEVSEVLSLSLRYLYKSVDENTAILRSIDARLQRLEELQRKSSTWRDSFDKVSRALAEINGRQVALFAAGALTSAAITSLFYRTRTRNSSNY